MKALFLNDQISLLAKRKGFDEPCLAYWDYYNGSSHFFFNVKATSQDYVDYLCNESGTAVLAPLYQQVIDWLREEKYLDAVVLPDGITYAAVVRSRTLHGTVFLQEGLQFTAARDKVIEEALKLLP